MYGYIYKTTNLINGKIYIGQKHSFKFLSNKYLGSGKKLKCAIQHYGKENFVCELLEEIETKDLMDEREIYWIKFYNATNKNIGYNLSEGGNTNRTLCGENNPSKRFDVRTKISQANKGHHRNKGRKHTKEELIKMSNAMLGRVITEEVKRKLSKNAKNNPNYGMKGKHLSKEAKIKISKVHLGKPSSIRNKIHITNGIINKTIFIEELDGYIKLGFRRGRIIHRNH